MVRWHLQLDGQEFQQDPGVGDQQCLVCCIPSGHKQLAYDCVIELTALLFLFLIKDNTLYIHLLFNLAVY